MTSGGNNFNDFPALFSSKQNYLVITTVNINSLNINMATK